MSAIDTVKKLLKKNNKTEKGKGINDFSSLRENELVAKILDDFEGRKRERLSFELQWQLNINFVLGNQYCDMNLVTNRVYDIEKNYAWEQKEVFNHLAPIVETRLAKLARVRPIMRTRPATSSPEDVSASKICTRIVKSTYKKLSMDEAIRKAASWNELTGTAFFKSTWDKDAGKVVGKVGTKDIREGEIQLEVVSPFEIFPDNQQADSLDKIKSLIHARAMHVSDVKERWGIDVEGSDVNVFSLSTAPINLGGLGYSAGVRTVSRNIQKNHVLVIEYYEKPTSSNPKGRMVVIAGNKLLHNGDIPYMVNDNDKKGFPFVRQVCLDNPGSFWGVSVVERCIPIQRAYNAVKNKKHEYLNRAALGIIEVDDGSVDLEDLEREGLYPGKIIVKTPGSAPIRYLENGSLPSQFENEEMRLSQEFFMISGVSELSQHSSTPSGVVSGVALEALREQDDTRLSLTAENIRKAALRCAKQWVRLYRQFVLGVRIERMVESDEVPYIFGWNSSDLTTDDIVFETENELLKTPAQRRQLIMGLLDRGFFNDPQTGTLDRATRARILNMLEMGEWEDLNELTDVHLGRAARENTLVWQDIAPRVSEYDDHELHINEHMKFVLSAEFEALEVRQPTLSSMIKEHISNHKMMEEEAKQNTQNNMMPPTNNQPVEQNQIEQNPES